MCFLIKLLLIFLPFTLSSCSYCEDCDLTVQKIPYFINKSGHPLLFKIEFRGSKEGASKSKDPISWEIQNNALMPGPHESVFYDYQLICLAGDDDLKCGPFYDNCNYENIKITIEFLTNPHRCIIFSGPLRSDLDPRQWKPYIEGEVINNYDSVFRAFMYLYTIDEAIYQLATEEACPMDVGDTK